MSENPMSWVVEVYPPCDWGDSRSPAKVGWLSPAPVAPEKARQFAAALLEAADKADALNKEPT